jgi:hypothetical protein
MRSPVLLLVMVLAAGAAAAAASESASATVTVTATFGTRTSLDVSTQLLQFETRQPGQPATASVDFAAKARTGTESEVLLSVEALRSVEESGGAADVEASVTFEGEGEGTLRGRVASAKPVVAGRWVGSGRRDGRLVFALRAGARGGYILPVRFVLSAP